MLKHTTPRSSPNLSICNVNSTHNSLKVENEFINSSSTPSSSLLQKSFNERSVDCDGIVSKEPLIKKGASNGANILESLFESKFLKFGGGSGNGIGPVITHGKAIVRRGLSFNGKKDPDAVSMRSVKSEGQCEVKAERQNYHLPTKATSEVALKSETMLDSVSDYSSNSNPSSKNETNYDDGAIINRTSIKNNKDDNVAHRSKKYFVLSKSGHPSLKSLLRLPGVYGHIPVPEGAATGSPHILNPDSLSLNSADSFLSSNSGRASSRSWGSTASSNSNNTSDSCNSNASSSSSELTSITLKVFSKCLRSDIEYKTVNIGPQVTSRQLITLLLSKARMRHRDSNLFYLTMEVTVRRWSGVPVRALLVLEDGAKPAQLALCHPSGDLRFVLQMRSGGVIKVHDTVLMPGSQYKSLLISHCTNAEDTVQLLLNCCGRRESKYYFALHEVCQTPQYKDRRLISSEKPLEVKAEWPKDRKAEYVFVLRRNMSQALSLRKLTTLSLETKPDGNKENFIRKPSPCIGNSILSNEGNLTSKFTESKSIWSEGRMRGRSLSPTMAHSNLDEAVIDCTFITPVIIIMKSQSMQSESLNLGSNNKNIYGENSKQTWPEAKNEKKYKIEEKDVNIFDSTINCNKRDNTITQIINPQQGANFNLTNGLPTARQYTTNYGPKNPNKFSSYNNILVPRIYPSKFITTATESSADLNTQDTTNNAKLSTLSKIQEEKFAKALEKLNPHINDNESDSRWSKEPQNLFKTKFSNPSKYLDLKRQELKISENQRYRNYNEFAMKNDSSENRDHEESSNIIGSQHSVSSSAVQTELTCLPSKGIRIKRHKWNSVETLMDFQSSAVCNDAKDTDSLLKNRAQENDSSQVTIKDDKTEHQPGIQCEHNCKKCFYI